MLRHPRSFQIYVVGSPSLGFGEGSLFNMESEYAERHKEQPVKLFLGIGGQEEHSPSPAGYLGTVVSVSDFYRFSAILQERGYEGFDHTDVGAPLVAAGLRNVFANR